jgi:hypothetical protein
MVEGGEQARFAGEPRETLGIRRDGRRIDLDRDVAAQPVVVGTVDLTHAAGAKPRRDAVLTRAKLSGCN